MLPLYDYCTLTTQDDLLRRQPTPTRDDEVDSCPQGTPEVPEGSGVHRQTRDISVTTIVTRVLTSKEVEDGGLGEEDQRAPRLDVGPNLVRIAKFFIMQPQRLRCFGRG